MSANRIFVAAAILAVIFAATLAEATHTTRLEVRAPATSRQGSAAHDGETSVPSASEALRHHAEEPAQQAPTF
jgi:hypothetical protein